MTNEETKWWGWGDSQTEFSLSERPHFWPFLKERLDIPDEPVLFPPESADIQLPGSRLTERQIATLRTVLPESQIDFSDFQRMIHTYGKSYHDLLRIRYKRFANVPDGLLFPETEAQIADILRWAAGHKVALVPRGGGTSVVGGVEAVKEDRHRAVVVLNLTRMNQVLQIDDTSLTADVQAGIFGPHLEDELQSRGYTLGHYPESFEFSTLGGWIAARSAGQQSTRYGKIEEMVESLRIVTPSGKILETPAHPAAATGPDQKQLLIGSEGILGVITQAKMRLKPLPQHKFYTALMIGSFAAGMKACRKIMQSGIKPATVRLSDSEETEFILSLRKKKSNPLADRLQEWGLAVMKKRGFSPGQRSFLLLGFEGSRPDVAYQWKGVRRLLKDYKTFYLGKSLGQTWYRHRFENPYLRDQLLNYDIMVDTLETSTEWNNVPNLYHKVKDAILQTYQKVEIKGTLTAHLSHLYPTGSSLYFILLATPHTGKELEEWRALKNAACDAIVGAGGSISHHHGIGLEHKAWLERDIGDISVEWLRKMKQQADPGHILNPGKLLPEVF